MSDCDKPKSENIMILDLGNMSAGCFWLHHPSLHYSTHVKLKPSYENMI